MRVMYWVWGIKHLKKNSDESVRLLKKIAGENEESEIN